MKTKIYFSVILILVFLISPLQAREYGELVLQKNELVQGRGFPLNIQCNALFKVDPDKNIPDLRVFRNFFCLGPYSLHWDGVPGKVVTLFGAFEYAPGNGYLIIKKTDNKTVWITSLEDFPPNKWTKVPPTEDGYGGYEAYYFPGNYFEMNVASVKWGHWWDRLN